jgi:hypothetical protein
MFVCACDHVCLCVQVGQLLCVYSGVVYSFVYAPVCSHPPALNQVAASNGQAREESGAALLDAWLQGRGQFWGPSWLHTTRGSMSSGQAWGSQINTRVRTGLGVGCRQDGPRTMTYLPLTAELAGP